MDVFVLQINIDACFSPTVFTPPSLTDQTYELGSNLSNIVNPFVPDQPSCTGFTHSASISPLTTAVIFSADGLTHTVSSVDIADVGEYTITITVAGNSCPITMSSVSYKLTIVNPCETATFSFTKTPFPDPDPYEQIMGEPSSEISWNDPGDVAITGVGTMNCGAFSYEVLQGDGTSLDTSVFTEDYTTATKVLRVYTTDPDKAYEHNLKLVIKLIDYPAGH